MSHPYLIVPRLIEQPTWGGEYICKLKGWDTQSTTKIGQSYELFGQSKLLKHLTDTTDISFSPEIGNEDGGEGNIPYNPDEYISLDLLIQENPVDILGPSVKEKTGYMPLLIKLNQAAGNSFQLHVKPGTKHPRWKAKPESWYFLENGYISCGIKPNINVTEYKKVCHEIDDKMKALSMQVANKEKPVDDARNEAKKFIETQNPWQYVNRYETQKYDLIDLSEGGIHHSWEESKDMNSVGNIVYEVQIDVMDPYCTLRSFDQGKMKDDGSIREIHIDDYFEFLDTNPIANDINRLKRTPQGNQLLQTPYYSLDILGVEGEKQESVGSSFNHLYVREGDIEIRGADGKVRVTTGHSCFIPYSMGNYIIKSNTPKSIVLKTYIPS